MKSLVVLILPAFFVLGSPSFGGEMHTAGNAPVPRYRPQSPVNYQCKLTIEAGGKTIEKPLAFTDSDFQGTGVAVFDSNGSFLTLSFTLNPDGSENLVLRLSTRLKRGSRIYSSTSDTQVPRSLHHIEGQSRVEESSQNHSRDVSWSATCDGN